MQTEREVARELHGATRESIELGHVDPPYGFANASVAMSVARANVQDDLFIKFELVQMVSNHDCAHHGGAFREIVALGALPNDILQELSLLSDGGAPARATYRCTVSSRSSRLADTSGRGGPELRVGRRRMAASACAWPAQRRRCLLQHGESKHWEEVMFARRVVGAVGICVAGVRTRFRVAEGARVAALVVAALTAWGCDPEDPAAGPDRDPPVDASSRSGISAACDTQIAKCESVSADLIRDCVAVARHCNPVSVLASAECNAQIDKCESAQNVLVDCPLVAVMCVL